MERKDLLIIMPAYNEGKNISGVLEQLEQPAIAAIADVLVINDASTDATGRIVRERRHSMVTNIFNLGYGGALQLGYKYAVVQNYQYVIQMDADGQHDVCSIPALYKRLREPDGGGRCPDIVLGSRFMEGSGDFPISLTKKAAHALFRRMIWALTGRTVADPTTGLQGLSRRAFLYYSRYNHFDDKYPDANMLVQMLLLGFRVTEVPAVMHARTADRSMHSGLRPVWYMFRMLFSMAAVVFRIKVLKIDAEAGEQGVDRI